LIFDIPVARNLERPEVGAIMVIEVQKDNHIALNQVNNHPIAYVGAHHAGQIVTEHLTNEGIVTDFGELV
jgi:hypothetical protein